jgi:hypothetical protein
VTIKSGDNVDCGHCVARPKQKGTPLYWCTLSLDMLYGKVLESPAFSAPAERR